jgi:hypothetical protein
MHDDIAEAIRHEKQLRKWKRSWKIELIEKTNPEGGIYGRISFKGGQESGDGLAGYSAVTRRKRESRDPATTSENLVVDSRFRGKDRERNDRERWGNPLEVMWHKVKWNQGT